MEIGTNVESASILLTIERCTVWWMQSVSQWCVRFGTVNAWCSWKHIYCSASDFGCFMNEFHLEVNWKEVFHLTPKAYNLGESTIVAPLLAGDAFCNIMCCRVCNGSDLVAFRLLCWKVTVLQRRSRRSSEGGLQHFYLQTVCPIPPSMPNGLVGTLSHLPHEAQWRRYLAVWRHL